MTYKTRQEVLRAAADWMDVCEKACVRPKFKFDGDIQDILDWKPAYDDKQFSLYEFPLALLGGKEVWVGSGLYDGYDRCVKAEEFEIFNNCPNIKTDGRWYKLSSYSWAKPKPATVMVELDMEIVEHAARLRPDISPALTLACKKALEKL